MTIPLGDARCFNPQPRLSAVALGPGQVCVVADDALLDPQALRDWAAGQHYVPPAFPYPGVVLQAPPALTQRVAEFFAQHVRSRLGARRTLDLTVRLSLVSTPPQALQPVQWLCHRDRVSTDPGVLFAASVLYLFDDPALGGTSFYRPRRSPAETDRLVADSQLLGGAAFGARYGLQPGYLAGDNDWFERIGRVSAAFNRMVFYDGSIFHSADVDAPERLSADPRRGRLTLNSFFTCRRNAR